MKRFVYLILSTFLLAYGCKNSDERLHEKLVGDWQIQRYGNRNSPRHFTFYEDGTLDIKRPYVRITRGEQNFDTEFLGLTSRWKVENGALLLLDPADSSWATVQVAGISADTLQLRSDGKYQATYVRKAYDADTTFQFNKILLSTSACFGSCPEADISLDSRGYFVYRGGQYAPVKGVCRTRFSPLVFQYISMGFRQVKIDTLKDAYAADHTDDRHVLTTFVYNDSVVKTVFDYGAASPPDFNRNYFLMEHLYVLARRRKVYNIDPIPYYGWGNYTLYEGKKETYASSDIAFMLWDAICQGIPTEKNFDPKYRIHIKHDGSKTTHMETDGRIFRIKNTPYTIDIGFNFVAKNRNRLDKGTHWEILPPVPEKKQ